MKYTFHFLYLTYAEMDHCGWWALWVTMIALLSRKTVNASLKSKQLLHFAFARQTKVGVTKEVFMLPT